MIIKFSSILSCSSEHPSYPASNLLEYKPSRDSSTWLCAKPGLLETEVVFELSEPGPVTGVDLGNLRCCSVRVSGSASTPDDWVTIVYHEFMSRNDAEDGRFKDQVQLFTRKEIGDDIVSRTFARVKVTCSQPANTKVLFGLSFLILRTEDKTDASNLDAFGRFKVKQKKDDSLDKFKEKYLQQMRPKAQGNFKTELAKEIEKKRATEDATPRKRPSPVSGDAGTSDKPTKRIRLLEETDPAKSPASLLKVDGKAARGRARCSLCLGNEENVLCKTCNLLLPDKEKEKEKEAGASTPAPKRPAKKQKPEKQFSALFEGVVFSLSGYKNPERDEIRRKAIAMGARYVADTSRPNHGCTHLICAFKNTPKYKEVKGSAKIVTHRWVEECYDKKTRCGIHRRERTLERVKKIAKRNLQVGFSSDRISNT